MPSIDINAQLKERFSAPLEHFERRRVVVWHDADGEFAEEFGAIAADLIHPQPREGTERAIVQSHVR